MQHEWISPEPSNRRRFLSLLPVPLVSAPFPGASAETFGVMEDTNVGQQDPAGGQGDIAAESSSGAAAPGGPSASGEGGLVADQVQPGELSYHLPATLDVSDGSGVSLVPRRPGGVRALS